MRGVLTDVDLLAAQTQTPFALRRAIDEARDVGELREAAARLSPLVVSLHDAQVAPTQVSAIIAIVADACISRFIELTIGATSETRRDPSSGSRLAATAAESCALIGCRLRLGVEGDPDDPAQQEYMHALAGRVVEQLAATGFTADDHGATAGASRCSGARSFPGGITRRSIENPDEDKGLVLISQLPTAAPCKLRRAARLGLRAAQPRRGLLRLMPRLALVHRPPTGFMRFRDSPRDLVVEHSGEHRGQLDIKHGGLLPITAIARYASIATGGTATSTVERLGVAGTAGTLDPQVATTLEEAFELFPVCASNTR